MPSASSPSPPAPSNWRFTRGSPTDSSVASPAISVGCATKVRPSPGLRGGCIGVYRRLRKLFNLRGLYDAQRFFALSTVVLFTRLSDPSGPSLVPQTASGPLLLQVRTRPVRGPHRSL